MPSRNARSSIADSSAKAPVVAPGPRMYVGGLMSSGTTRYVDRMFGEPYRNLAPGHEVVLVGVVPRGLGVRLVHDGADAPRPVGADRHALTAGGPVSDAAVVLLAGEHQFDRASHLPGRERGEQLVRPRGARAAERAADERGDHPDLVAGNTERVGVGLLRPADALHLVPHGEPVAVPAGDGRRDLHRVVVVAHDRVAQIGDHRGAAQRVVGVAARVVAASCCPASVRLAAHRYSSAAGRSRYRTSTRAAPCMAASSVVATTTATGWPKQDTCRMS